MGEFSLWWTDRPTRKVFGLRGLESVSEEDLRKTFGSDERKVKAEHLDWLAPLVPDLNLDLDRFVYEIVETISMI